MSLYQKSLSFREEGGPSVGTNYKSIQSCYMDVNILNDVTPKEVLIPIYSYLFETVFPAIPAEDINSVLEITRDILGEAVCPSLHVDQCTEECVIKSIQNFRHPEQAASVIKMLVNHTDNEYISNCVINFIELHLSDKITVKPKHEKPVSVKRNITLCGLHGDFEWYFSAINSCKMTNVDFCTSILKLIFFGLIIAILALFVVFVVPLMKDATEKPFTYDLNQETTPVYITEGRSLPNQKLTQNITTYLEYQRTFPPTTSDVEIELDMSIEDHKILLDSQIVDNKLTIAHLKVHGPITIIALVTILRYLRNVASLSILNDNCLSDTENVNLKQVNMSTTRHLKLEGFSNCTWLYDGLSKHVKFTQLQTIELWNGSVDEQTMKPIQDIITMSRNSLTSITFTRTKLISKATNACLGKLTNVVYFGLDWTNETVYDNEYVIRNISQIFPNLQTFVLRSGFMSWEQLQDLANCKQLVSITTGIKMLAGVNSVNLFDISKNFKNLKSIDLLFNFDVFNNQDGCIYFGETELKQNLRQFHLQSNCPPKKIKLT